MATQIVSLIHHTLHVEVPLQVFWKASTVADMAEFIIRHLAGQMPEENLVRLLTELEAHSPEEVTQNPTDEGR
jgi:hypothetical protein